MILNKINNLKNKKIAILGLGIENYALVKFLLKNKINCEITVCDKREFDKLAGIKNFVSLRKIINIKWQTGKNYDKNLTEFDVIFRSPGYPLFNYNLIKARKTGVEISSPMKLFFKLCPTKNIIGVTGTKGKGTTASLIYHILKKAGKRTWLGGNIGVAPFEFIDKIKKNDWVVLELSSFQLEDMTASPRIAVITNFHKEHLAPADPNNPNYHRTLKDYWEAKSNIFKWQKKGDYLVINKNFQFSIFNFQSISNFKIFNFQNLYKKNYKSKIIFFDKSDLPSKLIGEHNRENIAAAVEVAKIVGINSEIIKKAAVSFKGLEHRLEFVKKINGVNYYNDSFATTPESAITALKSFAEPIVLLAGGAEKKSDFKQLAKEIKKRVQFMVLLDGEAAPRLKKELTKANFPRNKMFLAKNIKQAVREAGKNAAKGGIVLLSPACASFGMFRNYKERGKLFKEEIKNKTIAGFV
ncbi:UDP-N-acetylmuramoyl-L-alanine--D-glutamate ligase [Patescibacteria group bacterium]|nr:UDP-N-acetylmuramoyl-L-alanine--D-glutamate ligase [Patescibacteria group bacterium]